jgi:ABC-type molybdate transport system ATPase subunit
MGENDQVDLRLLGNDLSKLPPEYRKSDAKIQTYLKESRYTKDVNRVKISIMGPGDAGKTALVNVFLQSGWRFVRKMGLGKSPLDTKSTVAMEQRSFETKHEKRKIILVFGESLNIYTHLKIKENSPKNRTN